MKKLISILTLGLAVVMPALSNDYVAVAKDGNVYDEASAKYITVNQNNEDVAVVPGMVFATTEHTPGWYKVEYSPGIHAFIPEQITATSLKPVAAGSYDIANNPGQKIVVTGNGNEWEAVVDGKTYKGTLNENILVFLDNNKVAFSVIDLGNGPIAITYDNSVTKFF